MDRAHLAFIGLAGVPQVVAALRATSATAITHSSSACQGWWVRVVGEVGSEWKAGKGVGVRCWLGRDGCVVSVMGGG